MGKSKESAQREHLRIQTLDKEKFKVNEIAEKSGFDSLEVEEQKFCQRQKNDQDNQDLS